MRSGARRLALTTGLVALLIMPVASPTRASFPGANGRIFYSRFVTVDQPSTLEIFSIRPDGTGIRRLTNNDEGDKNPSVSANGNWVVFQRTIDDNEEILKMKPDGSRKRRLTNTSEEFDNFEPAWSPSGNQIVFASSAEAPNAIHKMKANGDDVEAVTSPSPGSYDGSPTWSPDGQWIAFARLSLGDGASICFVRPNGEDEDCVTDTAEIEEAGNPDWARTQRRSSSKESYREATIPGSS